uniref:Uncharacterized protein n=1 Tax=Chromera velia CCMP2878 TaxID=1169474 RepID=A0A0G4HEX2_9ALVE|eukprot:Cvel_26877.t1-p1 / transcript=Cvel_26877.t1 / gene=Cvel_26877 / organism=Chromera_velia_CCMP2878 / gene_product=hypothetical protein / transcript_product=hypothetical protein / location=Cvel_scaffold3265:15446-16852(-) / protein_length=469 / sequence_SO=supercontig / SO=protein_coding / is_pseudo=false
MDRLFNAVREVEQSGGISTLGFPLAESAQFRLRTPLMRNPPSRSHFGFPQQPFFLHISVDLTDPKNTEIISPGFRIQWNEVAPWTVSQAGDTGIAPVLSVQTSLLPARKPFHLQRASEARAAEEEVEEGEIDEGDLRGMQVDEQAKDIQPGPARPVDVRSSGSFSLPEVILSSPSATLRSQQAVPLSSSAPPATSEPEFQPQGLVFVPRSGATPAPSQPPRLSLIPRERSVSPAPSDRTTQSAAAAMGNFTRAFVSDKVRQHFFTLGGSRNSLQLLRDKYPKNARPLRIPIALDPGSSPFLITDRRTALHYGILIKGVLRIQPHAVLQPTFKEVVDFYVNGVGKDPKFPVQYTGILPLCFSKSPRVSIAARLYIAETNLEPGMPLMLGMGLLRQFKFDWREETDPDAEICRISVGFGKNRENEDSRVEWELTQTIPLLHTGVTINTSGLPPTHSFIDPISNRYLKEKDS